MKKQYEKAVPPKHETREGKSKEGNDDERKKKSH